jgi:hypothetical protein
MRKNMRMPFAALPHLVERLCLSAMHTLKAYFLFAVKPHENLVFIMEWQFILLLKTFL